MVSPASGQPLKSPAKGYALIEVMISLVIVSVGLLGIAKMFALALGNTQVSGSRALAAIYAGSLSSAMHANRAFWQKGLAPASVTVLVNCTTVTSVPITCTITITWNEKYAGLNTSTLDASQQRATKTLTTVVQP